MNFELSEEQRMLKESAARLMDREISPGLDGLPQGKILAKNEIKVLLKKLSPLQYIGALLPEEYGGGGLDFFSYGLLLEELDYRLFSLVTATAQAAGIICRLAPAALRDKLLPPLLSGEMIACLAVSEPEAGSDTASLQTKAVRDGEYFVLNGGKAWITNGSLADVALVLAGEISGEKSEGISQFAVVRDDSPYGIRPVKSIADGPLPLMGDLVFENCPVPVSNRVGGSGQGLKDFSKVIQARRCLGALHGLGIAQNAVEAAVRYARERVQFGRPIGKFQLIQSMIADMLALTDSTRLLVYQALDLIGKGKYCPKEAALAGFYATETAVNVTSMAIQIHGAYGLSTEYPVTHLFKTARTLTVAAGTKQIQKLAAAGEALQLDALV
jgi:alkylation response protein AidB-like acyl-CoA dehydrogenase